MTIKKYIFLVIVTLSSILASAQEHKKFDPAKFEADLEQFITTEAALTPKEAENFFPLYREMRNKQFAYMGEERRLRHIDTSDDKACAEAIRRRDANDLDIKKLQQTYHNRFMRVLSPSKVFRVLRAEDKFHRQLFNRHMKKGKNRHGK